MSIQGTETLDLLYQQAQPPLPPQVDQQPALLIQAKPIRLEDQSLVTNLICKIACKTLSWTPRSITILILAIVLTVTIMAILIHFGWLLPIAGAISTTLLAKTFVTTAVVLIVSNLIIHASASLINRKIVERKKIPIRKKIGEATHKAFNKHIKNQFIDRLLKIQINCKLASSRRSVVNLYQKLLLIQKKTEKEYSFSDLQDLYDAFRCMYIKTQDDADSRAFLEDLSVIFIEKVDGYDAYKSYGAEILCEGFSPPKSLSEVSTLLNKTASKIRPGISRKVSQLLDPAKCNQVLMAKFQGAHYVDSLNIGTSPCYGWSFQPASGSKLDVLIVPGIFHPIIEAYQNKKNPYTLNLQRLTGHEGKRSSRWWEFKIRFNQQVHNLLINDSAATLKTNSKNPKENTFNGFLKRYYEQLKLDRVNSKKYDSSDQDCDSIAMKLAEILFTDTTITSPITNRQAEMIIFTFQTFVSLAHHQKAIDLGKTSIRLSCKDCMDRGLMFSISTFLMVLLAKNLLCEENGMLKRLIAFMFVRPRGVIDDLPLKKRLQPFLDMVKFLSENDVPGDLGKPREGILRAALLEQFPFLSAQEFQVITKPSLQ